MPKSLRRVAESLCARHSQSKFGHFHLLLRSPSLPYRLDRHHHLYPNAPNRAKGSALDQRLLFPPRRRAGMLADMPINLIVIALMVVVAGLLAYMVAVLGQPLFKLVRSGGALAVGRGVLLGVVLLAELAVVIALAVVVARL